MQELYSAIDPCHKQLRYIGSIFGQSGDLPSGWRDTLLSCMDRMRNSESALLNPFIEERCTALKAYITSIGEMDLLPDIYERSLVLQKCDELRLHILATGILALQHGLDSRGHEEISEELHHELLSSEGSSSIEQGGLLYTEVFDSAILVFPSTHNYLEVHDLLTALSLAYDQTPGGMKWFVDFSSVRDISNQMLATLISYRTQLIQEKRSDMLACWVPENLVQTPNGSKLVKHYDLREHGGSWFSSELL